MKSRITIEADFEKNSPYILIKENEDYFHPDVRDTLIKSFREKTGFDSSWCRIERERNPSVNYPISLKIYPITPEELIAQGEEMIKMGMLAKSEVDIDQLIVEGGNLVDKS